MFELGLLLCGGSFLKTPFAAELLPTGLRVLALANSGMVGFWIEQGIVYIDW